MLPQAVIFDMDGLMFDTERLARQAWQAAGSQLGYPIDETVLSQIRGATPAASAEIFHQVFGASFDYPAARALRNTLVEQAIRRDGLPVKPGLADLLKKLREQGISTAVASASSLDAIQWYLALANLTDFFQVIVSGVDVPRSKPAPDVFLLAAARLNVTADACLVLEDSSNGLRAAKAAGMRAICIPDIALPTAEALTCAEAVLSSLAEVWPWLQGAAQICNETADTHETPSGNRTFCSD